MNDKQLRQYEQLENKIKGAITIAKNLTEDCVLPPGFVIELQEYRQEVLREMRSRNISSSVDF